MTDENDQELKVKIERILEILEFMYGRIMANQNRSRTPETEQGDSK